MSRVRLTRELSIDGDIHPIIVVLILRFELILLSCHPHIHSLLAAAGTTPIPVAV